MRVRSASALALALAACAGDPPGAGAPDEGEAESESEGEDPGTGERCDEPGAFRCGGEGTFQRCGDAREWEIRGACAGTCRDGRCHPAECAEDEVACTDDGLIRRCDPAARGFRRPLACPPGESCYDGACRSQVCPPGTRFCGEDGAPAQCDAAGSGSAPVGDRCPELCERGVCRTFCDAAEAAHDSAGCVFYTFDSDVTDRDDGFGFDLMIGNPSDTETATVRVEVRDDDSVTPPAWRELGRVTVGPLAAHNWLLTCDGDATSFECFADPLSPDRHVEDSALVQGHAFRVTSDRPVVLYQINGDDYHQVANVGAASIVLPTAAIDRKYYVLSAPHCGDATGFLAVIGAADGTAVRVTLPQHARTRGTPDGRLLPAAGGETVEVVLDEGELLQLATRGAGDDLTGAYVDADAPVTVYAGHEGACPAPATGRYQDDALLEAMLPLSTWGTQYVAAAAQHGNPFLPHTLWRVLASRDGTTVSFENPDLVAGVPDAPVALDAGEFHEFEVTAHAGNPGEFFVTADQPIAVAEYLAGHSAYVLMVPVEQYLPRYVFITTEYYEDKLTFVRPEGAPVLLDGGAPEGTWYRAGGGHEVLWMAIAMDDIPHVVDSLDTEMQQPVGVLISGNGGVCSYAYIGGLDQERINLVPE